MTEIPATIGRYQVVRAIGQGGMGALYLALDPKLERQIAIKLLRGDDDELRERFAREARSVARLRHPNIVMIYDVGDHEGQPFIAMEFIQGQTLSEVIRQRMTLPTIRKLELMSELCDGLGFAHKAGVIHRDIKPANVMVDHEGLLKILDFGIARVAESTGMTQAGMLIGTLNYMSPEQVTGQQVDSRSDIFAVGALFYELLAYRQAFPGGLETGILHKILSGQPDSLTDRLPNLDAEIIRIVDRCIEKDAKARYQDLAAMRKDLQAVRSRLEVTTVAQTQVLDIVRDVPSIPPSITPSTPRRTADREELARRRTAQIQAYLDQGQRAFASGDFEAAIALCEQILLLDADDARALELLDRARAALDQRQATELLTAAEQDLQQGSLTAARELIDKAAKLDPSSARANELRQMLEDAVRERERARQRAEAIRLAMGRAQALFGHGSFVEAAAAADEALAIDATFAEASALKTRAQEAQRAREREAEQRAKQQRIAAGVRAARDRIDAREFAVALEELQSLARTEGNSPEISAAIRDAEAGRAAAEQAARRAQQVASETAQASELLSRNDLNAALARVNTALGLDAGHEPARILRDKIQEAIRVETERREAEARAEAERRREEERVAAAKREAEARAERERREAEERAARERQQAIADAMKKAKQAATAEASIAALREALSIEPNHAEAQKLLKAKEVAHEREQAETRRQQAIDRARQAINEQIGRGEFDSAERALRNAEQELNAKAILKPLRQQLGRARAAVERAAADKAAAEKMLLSSESSTVPIPSLEEIERTGKAVREPAGQPGTQPNRRQMIYIGAAAAVLVIGLAGYLIFGRSSPATPPSQPPAKETAAQPPSPTPPAPPPPETTPTAAPTPNPPEATAPVTPPPDPKEQQVTKYLREARAQLIRGDRPRALALAKNALVLHAKEEETRKLLNEMMRSARTARDRARDAANAAGKSASESFNYADAQTQDREADRLVSSGHVEEAIPLVWQATESYGRAALEPAKPAPPPPVAPPVRNVPPPVITTPAPAPPPPVATTPPAAKPTPPPSLAEEDDAIKAVVRAYAQAYTDLKAGEVQRFYPDVKMKELADGFAGLVSQKVEARVDKVNITGSTATVEGQWSVTFRPKVGKEDRYSRKVKLQLRKAQAGWIIVGRS